MLVFSVVIGAGLLLLGLGAKREVHRSIKRLSEQPCPVCGAPYGRAAAGRAREGYLAECEQIRRAEPTHRINFVREWRVECPGCLAAGYYCIETQRLEARTLLDNSY